MEESPTNSFEREDDYESPKRATLTRNKQSNFRNQNKNAR